MNGVPARRHVRGFYRMEQILQTDGAVGVELLGLAPVVYRVHARPARVAVCNLAVPPDAADAALVAVELPFAHIVVIKAALPASTHARRVSQLCRRGARRVRRRQPRAATAARRGRSGCRCRCCAGRAQAGVAPKGGAAGDARLRHRLHGVAQRALHVAHALAVQLVPPGAGGRGAFRCAPRRGARAPLGVAAAALRPVLALVVAVAAPERLRRGGARRRATSRASAPRGAAPAAPRGAAPQRHAPRPCSRAPPGVRGGGSACSCAPRAAHAP